MPASSSLVAASPCQVSAVSAKSTAPVQGCRTWLSQGPMLSQCFIPPPRTPSNAPALSQAAPQTVASTAGPQGGCAATRRRTVALLP